MKRLALFFSVAPLLLLVLPGCFLMPARVPMKSLRDTLPPPAKARCLLVLLPGAGDSAKDFPDHGFVQDVRARGLSVDTVAADATLGYYFKGSLEQRLHADVMTPVLAQHYERVYVLGISMGGMGALWYAHEHPDIVTNLVLFSPYLGKDKLVDEIQAAGGLSKWKAPAKVEHLNEDNYQGEIWRWLQAMLVNGEKGPSIQFGFGDKDRGPKQMETLAAALPVDRVHRTPGPHDWPTWKTLWSQVLDSKELAGCK